MDLLHSELAYGTKLYVDNKEYEIKWSKNTRQDDVFQVCQYIVNDILKFYSTDSVILKDHEMQEYGIKDIISFQVRDIFAFLPHKKEIRTYIKKDPREFRQNYYIISSDQIKIERFKEKTVKIDTMITNISIIKKQNQNFESTLRQIVESRLNNLQISNPQSPNLFFIEPSTDENLQEDDQQLSPKFGSSSTAESSTQSKGSMAQKVPAFSQPQNTSSNSQNNNNLLGGDRDQLFDSVDSDLKKRQKVAGLGTQQDYMKKQEQQKVPEIKGITMQEVAKHNTDKDAWIVINGKIYDVTHYLNYHPGGKDKLMLGVGRDGTELFQKYHPWVNAHYILQKNHIGFVVLK